MAYEFKGWDWTELAECWGITVEVGEKMWKKASVNGEYVTVTLTDDEAILIEKIKKYIYNAVDETGEFELNKKVKNELLTFISLIAEGKEEDKEVYKAIAELSSDFHLVRWVCNNLGTFWN